jgi:hypothetical protein
MNKKFNMGVWRSELVMNLNLTTLNRSGWSSPKFDQLPEPEPWLGSRFKNLGLKTGWNWTKAALLTLAWQTYAMITIFISHLSDNTNPGQAKISVMAGDKGLSSKYNN